MRCLGKISVFTVLFVAFSLLVSPVAHAEECKDSSGTVLSSQPIEGVSICATETGGKGDVAPYGNPDGKLDISDAVVTVQMFMQLLGDVDQAYMSQADVAPLCTQERKDNGDCSSNGNGTVGISDAVVIVRLAMKLEVNVIPPGPIIDMLFDLAGVTSLHAMDNLIEEVANTQRRRDGSSMLRYRIVDPATHRPRSAGGAGTNLIAVDTDGNAHLAIKSDLPVKVMYTVADPDREYVYLALDPDVSQALIAERNCALFRVKIADNSSSCMMEGVYLQDFDDTFKKKFGGLKPIQFNSSGNLYFAGSAFTLDGTGIDTGTWKPIIYQYDPATQESTPITHDALEVKFFMVLSTGELVYQGANVLNGEEKLWLYHENASIALSNTPPEFLSKDTYRALFWSGHDAQQQPGIWFARPRDEGGVQKAILYTFRENGDTANPEQFKIGDDGRLYGVFFDASGVEITQFLPHHKLAKAHFVLPQSGKLRNPAIQVSQGYVYYLESVDPRDGFGNKDVIQKVDLLVGDQETILSDKRYEIHTWRLSGKKLHFSGLDLTSTILITGFVDTLQVRQGKTVDEYLVIQEVASALSAAGRVRDIEILTPQEPIHDPGGNAKADTLIPDDSPYSLSIEFMKYMDKESVESSLTLSSANGDMPVMPIWFYRNLHLIPDLDGLLDGSKTLPLTSQVEYTLVIDSGLDIYGWQLVGENGQPGINKTFTPQTGGSGGSEGGNTPPTISKIADQSILADTSTDAIMFTVGDAQSDPDILTITVNTSNSALVAEDQVSLDGSGAERSLSITPTLSQSGIVTITVSVSDGTLTSSTSFTLTVETPPANQAPVANNGTLSTDEDISATGTLSASDAEGDALTYQIVSNSSLGSASITNSSTGAYSYTPNPNANGSDSFTFKVNGGSMDSNIATVSVTINPVNDDPVAGGLSPSLADGLVAYYPFNGNANDESGNGNNGVVYNGAALTLDRFGHIDSAYDFDGSSNYIAVPDTDMLDLTSSLTLTAWVKVSSSLNRPTGVVSKGRSSDGTGYRLGYRLGMHNESTPDLGLNNTQKNCTGSSPENINIGQWSYVTGMWDGKTIKIYINASISHTLDGCADFKLLNSSEPLNIGRETSGLIERYFGGAIDDVRIYSRALSDAEIQELYTASANTTTSITTNAGTAYTGTLPASDPDGDDLTFSVVDSPGHGSVEFTDPNTGAFTYTPDVGYSGTDTFTYKVNDGTADSNIVTVTVTIKESTLDNGLIAYYPFNGNANDESGNGNNGIVSGAVLTQDRFGNANSAYSFDGTDDWINIPRNNAIVFEKDDSYSVSVIVKMFANSTSIINGDGNTQVNYGGSIFSKYACPHWQILGGNTGDVIGFFYDNEDGMLFRLRDNAQHEGLSSGSIQSEISHDNIQLESYHHIVGVNNADQDLIKLYVNGVLVGENNFSPIGSMRANVDVYIGKGKACDHRSTPMNQDASFFKGTMDEIRVYNRALSESEIQELYSIENSSSPKPETYTNSLGMAFNLIPSGTFPMGGTESECTEAWCTRERPQHQVTIDQPFYMQTTEVTQGQWQAVMGSNPSEFSSCGNDCPVEKVSWDDVQTFITTLNQRGEGIYRLPVEAEWEYAARAGTTTTYSFGNDSDQLDDYGWYIGNSGGITQPVALKKSNPWGLYDMHGNAHEWVQDIYSLYNQEPEDESYRVVRSGGFRVSASGLRSAYRSYDPPDRRISDISFRLVRIVSVPIPAPVAKTGQTTSYAAEDDGALQTGVAWPEPRFTDNGDGTVTDNLTGLIWLTNANCFDQQAWTGALASANTLASGSCGLSDSSVVGDWRLPNINELESLIGDEPDGSTLPANHPFINIQTGIYWSSTTAQARTSYAWHVSFNFAGMLNVTDKTNTSNSNALPVRGTSSNAPAKIRKTGQTISYTSRDDGDLQLGSTWSAPRFSDNGDGTINDHLTGLMWIKNANCWGDLTWDESLDKAFQTNNKTTSCAGYTGSHSDWRLPNKRELRSLIDHAHSGPALPETHLFTNLPSNSDPWYWSSTTYTTDISIAWYVSMLSGGDSGGRGKSGDPGNSTYVLLVRGGQ